MIRPTWVGLALLLIGAAYGVGSCRAPACPSPTCESARCEVATCRVEVCERTVEVSVFVPTLQCGRDELMLTYVDDNGFPTATCVKTTREEVSR